MKKMIIILIGVIYIASIVVVNFFGLEIRINEETIYATEIECASVTVRGTENDYNVTGTEANGIVYFTIDFIPTKDGGVYTKDNIETNPNTVQINYKVVPDTTTNKTVKFVFDEEYAKDIVVFNENINAFTFIKKNAGLTVQIVTDDGRETSKTIYIIAVEK